MTDLFLPGSEPGLLVAPLTPFTDDNRVDVTALGRQIDDIVRWSRPQLIIAAGVEAQEYQYLDATDRRGLAERTIELVDGRCPVAVGISHPGADAAARHADLAAQTGASAVQLLAPQRPFGGQPTTGELVAYFSFVAERSPLPIVLYLNPGPGADVSVEATIELARIPGIAAVKESSRNLSRVGLLITEIDLSGLARYYTTMQMLLATLELGGSGATMPAPVSEIAIQIIEAYQKGDHPEAARLQRQFRRFPARWMGYGLAPVMKATMQCLGRDMGAPYPPFTPITGADLEALRAEVTALGFSKGEH
ncbi:dihydrodipicolinate synthase family protein [Streptosporangium sp. NPDC051022]|uniref:dihydrodipicolinate synthase family protein n=1 Tax=Streptosporangium sp. NPDC051022 TaxID=3155752 RepID=UPI003429A345